MGLHTSTEYTIGDLEFSSETYYDEYSRPVGYKYPSGKTIIYQYNSYGHQSQITSTDQSYSYWEATEDDAFGNVTVFEYGNSASTTKAYDANSGRMHTIQSSAVDGLFLDHEYLYDSEGNLTHRHEHSLSTSQSFCYDSLYRLTDYAQDFTSCLDGETITYDALGNIKSRSDIFNGAEYFYGENGAGPHAVSRISDWRFAYDAAGQMTSGGGKGEISYTAYGKPTFIDGSTVDVAFSYSPVGDRIQRSDTQNGNTKQTTYLGGNFEYVEENGVVTQIHYIGDSAILTLQGATESLAYLHHDHLGSVVAKTDQSGHVIEHLGYNPWGELVDEWGGSKKPIDYELVAASEGYTGHEQISGVGLIHMGGRVYDPVIGRFLTPDPYIQDPSNSQSFNRYAYVFNNPLVFTDPSGYTCVGTGYVLPCRQALPFSAADDARYAARMAMFRSIAARTTMFALGTVGATVVLSVVPATSPSKDGCPAGELCTGSSANIGFNVVEYYAAAAGGDSILDDLGESASQQAISEAGSLSASGSPDPGGDWDDESNNSGGDRSQLRKNMEARGLTPRAGEDAHHIVAFEAKAAAPAREVLHRFGIGINSAENGVFLTGSRAGSVKDMFALSHRGSGIHSKSTMKAINTRLAAAKTRGEAIEALSSIRAGLLRGQLPR